MSTRRNTRWGYATLVSFVLIFTVTLIFVLVFFVQAVLLLWSGIPAQATIVGSQAVTCGGKPSHPGFNYTVQFTDRAGQVHLATLHGCNVTLPSASSFPIIYLVNDPNTIDLPSAAPMRFWTGLFLVIFIALVDMLFILLLIRA